MGFDRGTIAAFHHSRLLVQKAGHFISELEQVRQSSLRRQEIAHEKHAAILAIAPLDFRVLGNVEFCGSFDGQCRPHRQWPS